MKTVLLVGASAYSVRMHTLFLAADQERRDAPAPQSSADGSGGGKPPEIDWLMTGLAFIFPALGGGLFGYDIGATSGALASLSSAATAGSDWCDLKTVLSQSLSKTGEVQHCSAERKAHGAVRKQRGVEQVVV